MSLCVNKKQASWERMLKILYKNQMHKSKKTQWDAMLARWQDASIHNIIYAPWTTCVKSTAWKLSSIGQSVIALRMRLSIRYSFVKRAGSIIRWIKSLVGSTHMCAFRMLHIKKMVQGLAPPSRYVWRIYKPDKKGHARSTRLDKRQTMSPTSETGRTHVRYWLYFCRLRCSTHILIKTRFDCFR